MAKVSGVPACLAASTCGLRVSGVLTPFVKNSFLSVMAWPLRLR